jgi:hypothetical protein
MKHKCACGTSEDSPLNKNPVGYSMKGIGLQGLGNRGNKGFWVGDSKSPMKKLKDLSGDGKVTQKDVLIGRGVIDTPMKQKSPLKLKDACYNKVKASYKVFPSAYASGAIAKCRKNK